MHDIGLRILRGELRPGDPLPVDDDPTSDLNVSRTVVREAVKVLAAKGLVEARPKTGTQVRSRVYWNLMDPDVLAWRLEADPDDGFFLDVSELRRVIEPAVAALAAERASSEEVAELEAAFAEMEATAPDYGDAYIAADVRFHEVILDGLPQRAARPSRLNAARRLPGELHPHPQPRRADAGAPSRRGPRYPCRRQRRRRGGHDGADRGDRGIHRGAGALRGTRPTSLSSEELPELRRRGETRREPADQMPSLSTVRCRGRRPLARPPLGAGEGGGEHDLRGVAVPCLGLVIAASMTASVRLSISMT